MSRTLDIVSDTEMAAEATETMSQSEACPICGGGQLSAWLVAPDRFHLRKQMYRLVRCSSCGGVSLASPPTPAEMWEHYTEDYHKAIVTAGEGSAASRWKDQVKLISQHKPGGGVILDIGCSSGGFLSTMKGPAWKLHGIEMEESTAERARATTGAEVFVGDAVEAPFLSASFDVITCFDVLEHVYSPRHFLAKVLEWLKPGGIFYAMMPNIASWEAQLFGSHWFGLELPRHLSHFSPASLRYLMTEVGFEEVCVKTPRVSYMERSAGYVCSSLIEKLGFSPTPQAKPKPQSLPMKVVRKGLRVVVITPLAQVASVAGGGPCLEVVFRKKVHVRQK
jgi:SAM-dependent methyltransferase